jgi:short subunit dehydrogenase-like uncharacterized protein
MMSSAPNLLVYGANGYTARLLLPELRARGIDFIVAGRNAERVNEVARAFDVPARVFPLDDLQSLARGLAGIEYVVNAAGPFLRTAEPLLRASLASRVHYLDVSGELAPLMSAASLDREARERGVMLLPGIGFDVVPSDCLAVHLAHRLPEATGLVLSICGSNLLSHGSALTFAEHAGTPVFVRRAGALEPMRFRVQMRWVDFGIGVRPTIAVSWGDLVTAFHSTQIENIEVYFEATTARWLGIAANQYWGWMCRLPGAKGLLRTYADLMPSGPSEEERSRERSIIIGEAWLGTRRVRSRLVTSEAYTFTAHAAASVLQQVMGGVVQPGFQTPGKLLGSDFVLSIPGTLREDLS